MKATKSGDAESGGTFYIYIRNSNSRGVERWEWGCVAITGSPGVVAVMLLQQLLLTCAHILVHAQTGESLEWAAELEGRRIWCHFGWLIDLGHPRYAQCGIGLTLMIFLSQPSEKADGKRFTIICSLTILSWLIMLACSHGDGAWCIVCWTLPAHS